MSTEAAPLPDTAFEPTEAFARSLDAADPLGAFRERFHLPRGADGAELNYLCGNSLGLQPRTAAAIVEGEMEDWATIAVAAHMHGRRPWYPYHERFLESGARVVGARAGEVVMMNTLTVNLHLMMVSFFRPEGARRKILIEHPAFPSDLYAVRTHLTTRGLDPDSDMLQVHPREGEHVVRHEDLIAAIEEFGSEIALVLLPGVNFLTGQVFDIKALTAAAHEQGAMAGFDLAHAAGNIEMSLHDWDVDFACWCTYKYLCGGPGSVAGCFVHQRHGADASIPRYAGWWGDDPAKRFEMHKKSRFIPQPGVAGWQVSNPPILSLAPLLASLEIFDEATIAAIRAKSVGLTGYMRWLIEQHRTDAYEIITPADAQGCQLSLLVHDGAQRRFEAIIADGIVVDFREPNVIRVAPAPLYNNYHEVWRFVQRLTRS